MGIADALLLFTENEVRLGSSRRDTNACRRERLGMRAGAGEERESSKSVEIKLTATNTLR